VDHLEESLGKRRIPRAKAYGVGDKCLIAEGPFKLLIQLERWGLIERISLDDEH